ncbi:Sensitivity To Red Light Reduced-like SRR1 [Pyrenophora seminiperda CCB06]|uniref:Sensitivity To Red Light Reduced-like SRR1 n=1 Tax=Pyrenophora seminiperda CCB06 TaxID=1302712 RepID=A0A3M7M9I4_9PLEO|nr:Sensitivity To Red Light Reduced-like SRR1 [Pyrenophora seminiperda CCB06]
MTAKAATGLEGLSYRSQYPGSDSEDDYESSSDGRSSSDEKSDDEDEDDKFERAAAYSVNLAWQENALNRSPVYTRSLLESLSTQVKEITKGFSLPPSQRTLTKIFAPGPEGNHHKIWDSCGNTYANSVRVHYAARVELNPDFQRAYGSQTDQIRLMRRYNKANGSKSKEEEHFEHFTFPYALSTHRRLFSGEHRSNKKMQEYWDSLLRTKHFWSASSSRLLLRDLFTGLAKTHTTITKVVCFGLGAISLDKSAYQATLQYMAVFSIIAALQEEYRRADPARPGIKLFLQDPNYEPRDHQLLRKLWAGKAEDLVFVSDPDGVLAIDVGTIVVSAFLPIVVPLVQIIADLFHDKPESGPAMMIGNGMLLDLAKETYSLAERGAPHVARFFHQQYEKLDSGFEDCALERAFVANVYGEGWTKRPAYWLNDMELWARKVHGGWRWGDDTLMTIEGLG